MRLFLASATQIGIEFNLREKQLLFKLMSLYPVVPGGHHRLTRHPLPAAAEHQKLLEDSMADHQQEVRQKIQNVLTDPTKFAASGSGFRWTAGRADIEWILQILNEVRIGSWLMLGSPNMQEPRETSPVPARTAHYVAMDLAANFEMVFIAALNGDWAVQPD